MHSTGQQQQPNPTGLDAIDVVNDQSNMPSPWFAGVATLPGFTLMNPLITKTTAASGPKSKSSGGSSEQKNYHGHMVWEFCCGQVDFLWGVLINNDVVWPKAAPWDSQIWQPGHKVIWTDGNVYKAGGFTPVDPPAAPWFLFASPWVAGTYAAGTYVLFSGSVFVSYVTTSATPPSVVPTDTMGYQIESNGWKYISSPRLFTSYPVTKWPANSIVTWKGRLYTNGVTTTSTEPPGAPWSLWRQDLTGGPNPFKFTVEGVGDFYLYWGTATQTLDTVNEQVLNNFGHPAYRNRVVLVGKNFLFGRQQNSPPNVQLLLGRTPNQTLITGASAALDADWQANPVCCLAEILSNPVYGFGIPDSGFDQASWQAEADRCAANPALYYISPLYDTLQKFQEIITDLASYWDGFAVAKYD